MKIILGKSHLDGPISGADETLVTYASQLQKAGAAVSVLLMYLHAEEDQYYQRLLESEVPVSWIASNLTRTSLGAGRRVAARMFLSFPGSKPLLRRRTQPMLTAVANHYYGECRAYLEKERPDVVHVMTPNAGATVMIRAAHDAGIQVMYQELGIPYHPPGFDYYEEFTSVLPLCSQVAALSPSLFAECREKLTSCKALSILPIMSQGFVNGNNHAPKPTEGKIIFGFAARIEKLKGAMVLIEALGRACRQEPNLFVNIAGDGSERQKIAARVKALSVAGHYRYHGVYTHPEECRAFMDSLDVFVMPSFTEGTPNSIVEAMACGKPVIASAVGGIPDMVGDDAGLLVAPGDVDELASAMLRLARDHGLREQMGQAARARYRRLFSPKVVTPLMLETYRQVVNNGSARAGAQRGGLHPWACV
ncbi:MAG TPA: glycosyltransferase family 4 protein [Pyrinomonadaceae bacterium]|nr:glycosyltransferase family 4 protein [Pyrinomonadaceae bacterium]